MAARLIQPDDYVVSVRGKRLVISINNRERFRASTWDEIEQWISEFDYSHPGMDESRVWYVARGRAERINLNV